MTGDEVAERLNVSRETIARFEAYIALLVEWQEKINLVAAASLGDVWQRHILDCGQIFPYIAGKKTILDMGSGAGLPGLVLAMMAAEKAPDMRFIFVESDSRKCAFLRAAARECNLSPMPDIVNSRMENLPTLSRGNPPDFPDVITARAVAPLEKLLAFTRPQWHDGLECLFFKGAKYRDELTCLEKYPNIAHEIIPSATAPAGDDSGRGVILRLGGFPPFDA